MFDYFRIRKVLIIAPAKVISLKTWQNEIEKWNHLNHLTFTSLVGTPKKRIELLKENTHLHLISTDLVTWLIKNSKFDYDAVIIDELSMFKNYRSQRFKALRKVIQRVDKVVGLTGTPSPNGYEDLWSQLFLLDGGERLGKNITAYRNKYFNPDKRNQHVIFSYKLKEDAKEQIDEKISDVCISMKSEDWLEMPDLIENVINFELENYKEYQDFEREMILELEEETIAAPSKGVAINKLLQYTSGAVYNEEKQAVRISDKRLDVLESIVGANERPILVLYNFKHERESILKRFKARELKTEQDQKDWNEGKIQMLIAHPASIGYGINIQYGSNIIVWYGLNWSLELNQQANARLYRQGQKEAVIVNYIVAKNTVDEKVMDAISRKEISQEGLLAALKAEVKS